MNQEELFQAFKKLYGVAPRLYQAPGRVNLIGEHTDYNDGFVMPVAINLGTWVGASSRSDRVLKFFSDNYSQNRDFDLNDANPQAQKHWSDYPRGVAWALEAAGYKLKGANLFIKSEVPQGAGLSSSAALEVAVAQALLDISSLSVPPEEIARLCQKAENGFVGAACGIMDQFIACLGQAGHALLLDCRSLAYRAIPLPNSARIVVCNSGVKHSVAHGEYNKRRAQCEEGVAILKKSGKPIHALRDATPADLDSAKANMAEEVYRRCRHVISENARVSEAAQALEKNDLSRLSQLMAQSHRSLRDDYEVSCVELDTLVDLALKHGALGARMTGAGFGGCTVNLVSTEGVPQFCDRVSQDYQKSFTRKPDIYVCAAAAGAGTVAPIATKG